MLHKDLDWWNLSECTNRHKSMSLGLDLLIFFIQDWYTPFKNGFCESSSTFKEKF